MWIKTDSWKELLWERTQDFIWNARLRTTRLTVKTTGWYKESQSTTITSDWKSTNCATFSKTGQTNWWWSEGTRSSSKLWSITPQGDLRTGRKSSTSIEGWKSRNITQTVIRTDSSKELSKSERKQLSFTKIEMIRLCIGLLDSTLIGSPHLLGTTCTTTSTWAMFLF